MTRLLASFVGLAFFAEILAPAPSQGATLPPGFAETVIIGPSDGILNQAVGLTFESNGRIYVWERTGRVWIKDPEDASFSQLLDISEEVGAWVDHGLLGFALDPNFRQNGYIYLLYVVDRHHLLNFGTPAYSASANEFNAATIGRLARYTCHSSDGFRSVDLDSRQVLIGSTKEDGIPVLSNTHGVGTLLFGADGTLLVSCGDGAIATTADVGGASNPVFGPTALADGIIRPKEDVGAFRSQLLDSLSGKILRIDPATGEGIASNPFYESATPGSARSRVWALGLRNPYRMSLKPNTGSHDPEDASPGVLMVGDVGWETWESLKIVDGPGLNFGWPIYEGLEVMALYDLPIANQDAPNLLYPAAGCSQYFSFRDLLKEDTLAVAGQPPFLNACGPPATIPASIPQFLHRRPVLDWNHGAAITRTPIYGPDGEAEKTFVGALGSPVQGTQFQGNASVGGAWYTGELFPPQYRNTYFQADWGAGVIKRITFGPDLKPLSVSDFLSNGGNVAGLVPHPTDGSFYYISFDYAFAFIRKISYVGNRTPLVLATADLNYGPAPLAVQFSSLRSVDPDNQPLTYSWNFGDGSPVSTLPNPSHSFSAPAGVPTKFIVTLTVTDTGGLSAQTNLIISANNTPPQVTITSLTDGSTHPADERTTSDLIATVTDNESADGDLHYEWQTILHHNNHNHSSPPDTNHVSTTVLSPAPCDGFNVLYHRVLLTVTDPAGLSTTREVRIYPDCSPNTHPVISDIANRSIYQDRSTGPVAFNIGDAETAVENLQLSASSSNPNLVSESGVIFAGFGATRTVTVTPTPGQTGVAIITVTLSDGPLSSSDSFVLTVNPAGPGVQTFADLSPIEIPDAGGSTPYPSYILVAGMGGTIANATLTLNNFSHQWSPDVHGLLVSPGGAKVRLFSAVGNGPADNATLTLSDSAAIPLNAAGPLVTGTFRPGSVGPAPTFPAPAPAGPYAATLSAFNGAPADGFWSLYVFDDFPPDHGAIAGGWSLTLQTTTASAPPTIGDIADRFTVADTPTGPIPITLTDSDTAAGSLTLSATSSNPTLVPTANMAFSGSGFARNLTIMPALGQTGASLITVTVSDGNAVASSGFVLSVSGVNTAPTISAIADQNVDEDVSTEALSFTVEDAELPSGNLALSAASTNPTLVPLANIVFGGTAANRTVTINPAANLSGSATITVTVSDGALSADSSFLLTVAAVDDAPSSTPIANQTTPVNTGIGPIAFTVDDAETAAGSLTVAASSSNQTLVPDGNISLGGSGASRNVSATPAAGEVGTTTITITVSDGQSTTPTSFLLTVTPPNAAPTISSIDNQPTPEDTAVGPLAFTVGDAETAPGSLSVSGTSSNPSLIPNGNIVFGGAGASRTVTVTPAANASGSATVTLSVSDGQAVTQTTFDITVNALNDPPTISVIPNSATTPNNPTAPISFTVGDVESSANDLTVTGSSSNPTVVPNANIVFGGSGANRTVTVTPASGQLGTATITVTVSDGDQTSSRDFQLAVDTLPVVIGLQNRSTFADAAIGPFNFSVADAETPAGNLTVSALSSNPALLPVGNIILFNLGSGQWTMTLVPAAGQTGTALVTVLAYDGLANGSNSFVLTVSDTGSGTSLFSNPGRITMPSAGPANPYPSTIDVTGVPGTITRVLVTIEDFAHDFPQNVDMLLVSPTGEKVLIWSDVSGSYTVTNLSVTLSDSADYFLPLEQPLLPGNYKPTDFLVSDGFGDPLVSPAPPPPYALTLAAFNGISPNGTWSLYVIDEFGMYGSPARYGIIDGGWKLILTTISPPTISDVPDQSTPVNTRTAPIAVTVNDAETPAANLTLTGTSSNHALVLDENILISGSGSSRTVRITPEPDQMGTATITLTVSDGTSTANDAFVLSVVPAPLTVTVDNLSREYGAANPPLTATIAGLAFGDDISVNLTTAALPASPVGTYPITVTFNDPGNRLGFYSVTTVPGNLTVTPAPLTVTAQNATKTYGSPNPPFTGTVVGIKNGDNITATFGSAALTGSPVGSYSITSTPSDPDGKLPNYFVAHFNGTLTVSAAGLTVTAEDKTKVYGAALPSLTASYSGFVNGDTAASLDTPVHLETTATISSGVGTYAITASEAADANYTVTFVAGTLHVTPAGLTVTADDKTKVYGAALPSLTASYSGFVNGDTAASLDTPVHLETTATISSGVGTYTITASAAADANYTVTFVAGTLHVTPAGLTVTADDKTKVYGAALPSLTASYSGFVNGDTGASLDTPVHLETTATISSGVGTYTITASAAADANYTVTFVAGTLHVTPAGLAVTADDKTKVYGAALPSLTASYSGFVNGDTAASLDTPVHLETTATISSGVGTYAITASAAADANYTVTFVAGTLHVTPAGLTVTADDKTKVYGAALPSLTASYSGFVNGDTAASLDTPVHLETTATISSGVGTYTITASAAADANYTVIFVAGTLHVTPAGLTVTADDKTKVYGAALPLLTASYSGFVNGDTAASLDTPVHLETTATISSGVGTYAITASAAADANYTVTFVGGTLHVTPAGLTVTADDKTKVYGAALPSLTASYSGFVNGDTAASLDTPVHLETTATISSGVGTYTITASAAADANYTVIFVAGTLTVTPAGLTVTAEDKTKVYGAALPSLTASYSGFVNGDTAASLDTPVHLETTATISSGVGTYAITASAAADANYTVTFVAGILTVTPAGLTVTADDKTKVYGAALPSLTASYSGFVNGDTAASLDTPVHLETTATISSGVGTYTITASAAADANYTVIFVAGTLTVTPAGLTVTADDKTKVYGAALPSLTASYSGFVNGDTAASLDTPVHLETTATISSGVGTYTITASAAADANYTVTFVAGILTVTPAGLTVTADDKTKVYGVALPSLTASYSGFVNGDTAASLDTPVHLETTATISSGVGTYTITASAAADANYTVTFVAGTLHVTPAGLTVTADDKTKVYGAALPSLTASYSGFVNGDTAASLDTPVHLETTATISSGVGTYTITASAAADANYTVTFVAGTLHVTPAGLTVTADDKTKVYGAALPSLTASYSGFVNGDTGASLDTPVHLETTATISSGVGTYTITASAAADANYTVTFVAGTLHVTPAGLAVTADDKTKVYGAALPSLTASYSGFVNGDTAASLDTPVHLETTATISSGVGTYAITASAAADANYTVTFVAGTLHVTPAGLTVTADDKTKVYGAALPSLTASYSGFVNGDTAASLDTPVHLETTATISSGVGTYTITAGAAADANYTVTFVAGALTVTPAGLTVTADDKTKVYGDAFPTLTAHYTGFVNGDTAASLDTPVSLNTTATANSGVGTYAITASAAADANYTLTFVAGTLTVTPAALTVTADDKTKVYGDALPTLTAHYTGFVNGDTAASLDTPVSLNTTATANSGVGTYAITASAAADANYTVTFVAGTLTVTPAALTVTADDKTKVYGDALPTLTAHYTGFVNGDTAASLDTPVSLNTTATANSGVGTYAITASAAADANYTVTFVAGTLTVTPAALTVTADDKTKVYGDALPTLTAHYTGFVNGDTAASLDTPVSLNTTATANSGVGTYAITASAAADANYTVTFVAGTLTVTPAALTVTADDKTKVYGDALPTLTAHYTGFVNGDTAASLDTPVSLNTTATANSGVGTYAITASAAADANYTVTFVAGTLTVTPAALTVTADDKTKVYGDALPTLTAHYTGFVNGDTAGSLDTPVSLNTTATANSGVGTYAISASAVADANYTVTFVPGTLTVARAALSITADNKSRAYLQPNPTLTISYSGFVGAETSAVLATPASAHTSAALDSAPGNYPIVVEGATAANYAITFVNGLLTIESPGAPVVIWPVGHLDYTENAAHALLDSTATLDDSDTPDLDGGSLTISIIGNATADDQLTVRHEGNAAGQIGVGGADISYGGTPVATFGGGTSGIEPLAITFAAGTTPAVAQAILRRVAYLNVSETPSTLTRSLQVVADDGHGGLSAPATMTIAVTAVPDDPVVTWANPAAIVYGTALGAEQLNATASVTGTLDYTPALGTVLGAGAGQILSVTFTPNDSVNYNSVTRQVLITVNPASLTITAVDKTKVYGATLPTLTVAYSGFVNGDNAGSLDTPPALGTAAAANSFVGNYPITVSGAIDANYAITHVNGSLSVTPASLTVTADAKSKVYGASLPTLTASYSGFVNGDNAASLDSPATLGTAATANSAVGTYAITVTGAADPNYAVAHVNGSLSVTPAGLTITADAKSKVYGAAVPTLTASYSGFVNGDTVASLDSPAVLGTTATTSSAVGTYAITVSGAADANYVVTHASGFLNVTPANLTITAENKSKVYGAAVPTLTASYSGFVNGDTVASLDTPAVLGTAATASSAAGSYAITVGAAADANYTITFVNGTLTVTRAALTISADSKSKVYGASLPALTASYSGFVNGDNAGSLDSPAILATTATASSSVGSYAITVSGASDANYTITFANGTLTVTRAALTITADNKNKVYGAPLPSFTASYSGFVNGDTAASLDTPVTLGTTATSSSSVGSYSITASGAADANYAITFVPGALQVTPAALTISADNKTKTLGAALPTLTASYSGFVNGDTAASLDTAAILATTATAASPVGNYAITVSGAADLNYTITHVDGTLTVISLAVPSITILGLDESGAVNLQFAAPAGQPVIVEASDDLQTWFVLTTLPNATGVVSYTDAGAIGHLHRFYRASSSP